MFSPLEQKILLRLLEQEMTGKIVEMPALWKAMSVPHQWQILERLIDKIRNNNEEGLPIIQHVND